MRHQALIALAIFLIAAVVIIAVGASQFNDNSKKATPTPTATVTPPPTAEPTPTAVPVEKIAFQSVGIDNSTALSVKAYSQSGQEILVTKLALKDDQGNIMATDNTVQHILPANGTAIKIVFNQNAVSFSLGGTYVLTLTTANGASFDSPPCSPDFYGRGVLQSK
ncbi:MAG: hypothetical protein NWE93_04800 [Candidatus Bathyarchaeota archaeon]|nr:hypothetical protein [Candidatus Bathyarchaeota archaeon]